MFVCVKEKLPVNDFYFRLGALNFHAFTFASFCEKSGAKIKPVKGWENVTEAVTGDKNLVLGFTGVVDIQYWRICS